MPETELTEALARIFGPGGTLSGRWAGYEHRPGQQKMAASVLKTLQNGSILMAEAGTGTGKSLAYLIPAILWARANRKRVVVSTRTKALQDQLVQKDLPHLAQALALPFHYAALYGIENYLSLRRLRRASENLGSLLFRRAELDGLQRIASWSGATRTGLKHEWDPAPAPGAWRLARRDSNDCMGRECPHYGECFYFKARREAGRADILVVNHSLLFANLGTNWKVFPKPDALVLDEAHTLEGVAGDALGIRMTRAGVRRLLNDIKHRDRATGLAYRILSADSRTVERIMELTETARDQFERFYRDLQRLLRGQDRAALRIREPLRIELPLFASLQELSRYLREAERMARDSDEPEEALQINACATRVLRLLAELREFARMEDPTTVYWVERGERRKAGELELRSAPVVVGPLLKERMWSLGVPLVLTSATLTTAGSFDHMLERLGMEVAEKRRFGSPFDYRRNALLYVAEDLPDPKDLPEDYEKAMAARVVDIARTTRGATMVLCTSYRTVRDVAETLRSKLPDLHVLNQGAGDAPSLLRKFRSSEKAVLVATASFWQGVDIAGERLICVIIARLPFEVPDDPVTEARTEWIEERGGDPFREYSLPNAVLLFRQGFGRLIRTKTDWGVVAVLDPRLKTRRYANEFLKSLPGGQMTASLENLSWFVQRHRGAV